MRKFTKWSRFKIQLASMLIANDRHGDRKRGRLYEPYLRSVGKNFKLGYGAFIFNPNQLAVGNDVYIGVMSYIGNGNADLDDEVLIGNHVSITPSNHTAKDGSYRFGIPDSGEICIGKGVWLGAHVCVVSNVTICAGALIAAGSVVTHNVEIRGVYGGVPSKLIKVL